MNAITLSLCIPTFNRVAYLRELVPQLLREVALANEKTALVEFLVINNASTDETENYLLSLSAPALVYYRNESNIGGNRNLMACVTRARGKYVWIFGDDDLIEPGGLCRVVELLLHLSPTLLVLRDASGTDVSFYQNYGECVRSEMASAELFPLHHTLITSNVFRKDAFDMALAQRILFTSYAHMYGLMVGLRYKGTVAAMSGVAHVRIQRARFEQWPFALCVKQAAYLGLLAHWFHVPRLYCHSFRLAINFPVEIAAYLVRRVFPNFRRT